MHFKEVIYIICITIRINQALLNVYLENGTYNQMYSFTINKTIEYIVEYEQPLVSYNDCSNLENMSFKFVILY